MVLFLAAGLYADAGLQVVYLVLGVVGWWQWLRGGENRGRLEAGRATVTELGVLAARIHDPRRCVLQRAVLPCRPAPRVPRSLGVRATARQLPPQGALD